MLGFPESSVRKESTCNAGDPGSIPGTERSAREGIGCPIQYPWDSLVALVVKNPPTMWENWVQSLGQEAHLEKWKATHSSILAWRISWTVYIAHGLSKSQTWVSDFHFHVKCLLVWLESRRCSLLLCSLKLS